MSRSFLSVLLSFNGGYVDTVGFIALAGLFTAHVTGNFVTLGASIAVGSAGALAKVLALPLFCLVVALTRLASLRMQRHKWPVVTILMSLKLALLVVVAALAVVWGPVVDQGGALALAMGLLMVTAMAVQNAFHRVHMSKLPPTTLMTGTTTQIMLDIADLVDGGAGGDRAAVIGRLRRMGASLLSFAVGCAAAALAFLVSPVWCFALPPLIVALGFFALSEAEDPLQTSKAG